MQIVGCSERDNRSQINLSNESFIVKNGERIAQMVITKYQKANPVEVNELIETSRGAGGFGSTGTK